MGYLIEESRSLFTSFLNRKEIFDPLAFCIDHIVPSLLSLPQARFSDITSFFKSANYNRRERKEV